MEFVLEGERVLGDWFLGIRYGRMGSGGVISSGLVDSVIDYVWMWIFNLYFVVVCRVRFFGVM